MRRIAFVVLFGGLYVLVTAAIALGVFELRDGDDSSGPVFGESTDWVACQVLITNDEIEKQGAGIPLTSQISDRILDECGAPNDAWVLCVHQEYVGLSDTELLDFNTDTASEIADACEGRAR